MAETVTCNYCGKPAALITGDTLYLNRPDLHEKRFWRCDPCDAHVGCHRDGGALGSLANKELRRARMAAHASFDAIWLEGGLQRSEAYAWLSKTLNIPINECHIGMFTVEQCAAVLEACEKRTERKTT